MGEKLNLLAPNIKPQPKFWKYMPWLKRCAGVTINTKIYLRPEIYKDLQTDKPDPENVAALIHEVTHVDRIKELGIAKFGFQYLFSRKFRFQEELLANKASFTYLKRKNVKVDLLRKAWILSSWLYLWPVTYDHALEEVNKAWKDA